MYLLELFVNDVETKSISSPLHLCDQVANLLLSLHLLLKVLALDEVSQLGVSMGVSNFVHLKQRLKENIGKFDLVVIWRACILIIIRKHKMLITS